MRIALSADHRGQDTMNQIATVLRAGEHNVIELAVDDRWPSDYPDKAFPVAAAVAHGDVDMGILVDGCGIGMSIAANKVKGVRAALVHDEVGAEMSRRQMNANVLCIPADMLGQRVIERIVAMWIKTGFEGGRHSRRVEKIAMIEDGADPTEHADSGAATE